MSDDLLVCVGGSNATIPAPDNVAAAAAGTVEGTTVVGAESGLGVQKTVLTLASTPITIASTDTTTIGYGGIKIYEFPEGYIRILGASLSATITMDGTQSAYFTDATAEGDISIGSSIVNSAEALGSADTSDDDIVGAAAWTMDAYAVATAVTGSFDTTPASLDGTGTAIDANLNVTVDAVELTADNPTILVSGTVVIYWINESV